jgi:KDO2-lipid IV(A) lauroyltransferase
MSHPPTAVSYRAYLAPRFWPTWLGLALMRIVAWLPTPLVAVLGAGIGFLIYLLHVPRRRIATRNIELCFPQLGRTAQRRRVIRHFLAFGRALLDGGVAWWSSPRRLRRLCRFRGREHFERARARNQNVILLVPHFVGVETMGIRLSLDFPLLDIFHPPANALLGAVMARRRARFGARLVELTAPMTATVRAVKAGVTLFYLPDQNASRRRGVFAPFFGIPASTFPTLGRLARLTGAVVIPCIARQRRLGRGYEIIFRQPLAHFPSGDDLADTASMNAAIEKAVRKWPAQYFWVHQRFKTRPRGEPKLYKK